MASTTPKSSLNHEALSLAADVQKMSVSELLGVNSENVQWQHLFGPAPGGAYVPAFDRNVEDTHTLPYAYRQNNKKISSTIELAVHSDDDFMISHILPINYTDQLKFAWDHMDLYTLIAPETPDLGTVRWVGDEISSGTGRLERRGIGLRMEHGFMKTEEGIKLFYMKIAQIIECCKQAVHYGVLDALLKCHQLNREFVASHGGMHVTSVREYLQNEATYFDMIKKNPLNGMEILDQLVLKQAGAYGVHLDTILMPQDVVPWRDLVPKERLEYNIAGPAGPSRLITVPNETKPFRGKRVHQIKFFSTGRDRSPIEVLKETRQIGEYTMFADDTSDFSSYRSKSRHAQIYDEDNDKFTEVTLDYLIENSMRFDGEKLRTVDFSTKWDQSQIDQDLFTYRDESGQQQTTALFGQISPKHLSTDAALNVARTALNSFPRESELELAFNEIQDVINLMDSQTMHDPQVEAFVKDLAQAATRKAVTNSGLANAPPSIPLKECARDRSTDALEIPSKDYSLPVPPGFQSWAGFQYMSNMYSRNTEVYVKYWKAHGERHFKAVHQFVTLFRLFVNHLEKVFPNSVFLDARLASSWWHNPTKYTTAFENLVRFNSVPGWFATSLTVVRDSSQESDATKQLERIRDSARDAVATTLPDKVQNFTAAMSEIEDVLKTDASDALSLYKATILWGLVQYQDWSDKDKSVDTLNKVKAAVKNASDTSSDKWSSGVNAKSLKAQVPKGQQQAYSKLSDSALGLYRKYEAEASQPVSGVPLEQYLRAPFIVSEAMSESIFDRYDGTSVVSVLMPSDHSLPDVMQQQRPRRTVSMIPVSHLQSLAVDDLYSGPSDASSQESRVILNDQVKLVRAPNFVANFASVEDRAGPLSLFVSRVFYGTLITKHTVKGFAKNNVVVPFHFMVVRPHMVYDTYRAMWVAGGGKAGSTWMRQGTFEIAANVQNQETRGTYTFHAKSLVTAPQYVYHVRDIYTCGYHGGNGVVPITDPQDYAPQSTEHARPSAFVFMIPYTERDIQNPFDISGEFRMDGRSSNDIPENKTLHYSQAPFYNSLWAFPVPENSRLIDEMTGGTGSSYRANTIVFHGHAQFYNTAEQKFSNYVPGTGHNGDFTYIGCNKVRAGQMVAYDSDKVPK
jgi:hypothetical protein